MSGLKTQHDAMLTEIENAPGTHIISGNKAGLMPASNTNLDNATATRLGLKAYAIGTTYNNATNIGIAGGVTVSSSSLIPYQMQDGSWRLRFNIVGTQPSASSATITLTDVNYSYNEAISSNTGVAMTDQTVVGGTSNIVIGSASNFTVVKVSGDVTLASKPTWAY